MIRNVKLNEARAAVERKWGVPGDEHDYQNGIRRAESLLTRYSVPISGFSHFGIVVPDVERAVSFVRGVADLDAVDVHTASVESYGVRIARFPLGDVEFEFVEPVRESFFAEYLRSCGAGLHHLSYQVKDIDETLSVLGAKGEHLYDRVPREGSHGKVAFAAPAAMRPLSLEVFQTGESRQRLRNQNDGKDGE